MFKDKKIGVLMGGISNEREISLLTGNAILSALKRRGYDAQGIDVDRNVANMLGEERIEIAFLALHGLFGEDGTVQGLLELMQIPYTGPGVLTSALAMDKIRTKQLFIYHGLPTPDFHVVNSDGGVDDDKLARLGYPLVVKDPIGGSTIDVYVVRDKHELKEAVDKIKSKKNCVLVEKYIDGAEITVCILDGEVLGSIEIVPAEEFYNYKAKYHSGGTTQYLIPPRLQDAQIKLQEDISLKAYEVLGCVGQARVDIRVDSDGNPFLLELNTIPGMAETSLLPKAASYKGIDFDELVIRILNGASLKLRP